MFTFACQKENVVVANNSNPNAEVTTQPTNNANTDVTSREVLDPGAPKSGFPCKVTVKLTVSGPCEYEVKLKRNLFPVTVSGVVSFNSSSHPQGVYTFVYPQLMAYSNQAITIFNIADISQNPNLPWIHTYSANAFVKIEIIPEVGPGYTYLMSNNSGGKPTGFKDSWMFAPQTVYSVWGCTLQQ